MEFLWVFFCGTQIKFRWYENFEIYFDFKNGFQHRIGLMKADSNLNTIANNALFVPEKTDMRPIEGCFYGCSAVVLNN
jgi:hypothetical protein